VGVLAVAPDPASAALVRHSIAADLLSRHVAHECVDDVVLVASELVTNAVLHVPTQDDAELDITWEVGRDSVVVGVLDRSPELPRRRTTNETDARGRGLFIVAALAREWGVSRTANGKQVWARVPLR
jgi:anti-sigma regulatory factor (Ser/Thr protein kinase)